MSGYVKDYWSVPEVAQAVGKTERAVYHLCQIGKFPGARKNGKRWEIPYADVYEYINPKAAEAAKAKVTQLVNEYGEGAVCFAQQKLAWINKYHRLYEAFRNEGYSRKDAQALAIEQVKLDISHESERVSGFSRTTLYRWKQKYRKDGLAGLMQ